MSPDPTIIEFLVRCGVRQEALARLDVLSRLLGDLCETNEQLNLTRITAPTEFWTKHVADSLSVGLAAPELLTTGLRVGDVGCGAGFPAIPLAWANPDLHVTGIESRRSKAQAVRDEVARLGLPNCTIVPRQARETGRLPEYAGAHDAVVLRAVGRPRTMVRDCRQLLKPEPDAKLIFYMTPNSIEESRGIAEREAGKYGFAVAESAIFELPGDAGTRQFLILSRR